MQVPVALKHCSTNTQFAEKELDARP